MGKRITKALLIMFVVLLSFRPCPVRAETYGYRRPQFVQAVRAGKLKVKHCKVGKTVLYYDTAISTKRVNAVKQWIKKLPSKVQSKAKRVYILRKKYYLMTLTDKYRNSLGYALCDSREIYVMYLKDSEDMRLTLWHEFGHCYDWKKGGFRLSTTKTWRKIIGISDKAEAREQFAWTFADFFDFISEPEFDYIYKALKGG